MATPLDQIQYQLLGLFNFPLLGYVKPSGEKTPYAIYLIVGEEKYKVLCFHFEYGVSDLLLGIEKVGLETPTEWKQMKVGGHGAIRLIGLHNSPMTLVVIKGESDYTTSVDFSGIIVSETASTLFSCIALTLVSYRKKREEQKRSTMQLPKDE
jgi:hypothetical protein